MLTSACATYVPIKYRVPSEFTAPEGMPLKVEFADKSEIDKANQFLLVDALNKEIVEDGWWTIANASNEKDAYRLVIEAISFQTNPGHSDISTNEEKKRIRSASYTSSGTSSFQVKAKQGHPISFSVKADAYSSSSVEIPKPVDSKKLFPVLGSVIFGIDQERDAIERQDASLSADSINLFRTNVSKAILGKITPNQKIVEVELDDDEDDMDTLKEFIKTKNFEAAYTYLNTLGTRKRRADIIYNLGIIQELRGKIEQACALYKEAYEKKSQDLYLKQNAACEARKSQMDQLVKFYQK